MEISPEENKISPNLSNPEENSPLLGESRIVTPLETDVSTPEAEGSQLDNGTTDEIQEKEAPSNIQTLSQSSKATAILNEVQRKFEEQDTSVRKFAELKLGTKDFKKLEEKFYSISPETLFFDVNLKDEMLEIIKEKFEQLKTQIPGAKTNEKWNEVEIDNMFGKGFNPTSLITSAESAEWFSRALEFDHNKPLIASELGCGAGWSTVMLFQRLINLNPQGKSYLQSIDMSPHAIATTQALLEYYGIKYVLVTNNAERDVIVKSTMEGNLESCVILNLGTFPGELSRYPDNYFNGIYSTHGSAYLSENEYKDLFNVISQKGKDRAVVVSDSLNPLYTNHLSTPVTLLQMIAPNLTKKIMDNLDITYLYAKKTLPNTSKYYTDKDEVHVIKVFNEKRADLILKWSNYLIKTLKLGRMLKTKKSLSVTMDVVERYRSDVFPSTQLVNIVDSEHFKPLPGAPEFTIFLETIGFRLEK